MRAAIVGWGHTQFGRLDGMSIEDLIVAATREAVIDAGLTGEEIDAVWLGHYNCGLIPDGFCSPMIMSALPGLRFKPAVRCENACASGAAALYSAIDAVQSGRVRTALVVGAEKMTARSTSEVTQALAGASYQCEESALSFPAIFAQYASAYSKRYGDPVEALAHIAVKNHRNALDNPLAHMRRPLTLEFCRDVSEKNPVVAPPLKLTDCSTICDGAAAVVIVRSDMIREFRRAVGFRATEQVTDLLPLSAKDLVAFEGPRRAIEKAYASAGVGVKDLSFAEVHDCFTIAELMITEALGIAEAGRGGEAICGGETARGGRLPVNLSGGLKAKGHPVGATGVSMHVMAARQLVGEADDMQVSNAQVGLCLNMGGGAVVSCVSILEPLR